MATVKAKIKTTDSRGLGRVYYQIIHQRTVRRVLTDIWIQPADLSTHAPVASDLSTIRALIAALDKAGAPYISDDIVRRFAASRHKGTFEKYFQSVIDRLGASGRTGGMKTYRSSLASFRRFSAGAEHLPGEITPALIAHYHEWLTDKGLMANTKSFYMRHMRAVYKMMVRDGLASDLRPFEGIFTGLAKTPKRAIAESELKKIRDADLTASPLLAFSRDIFLLSFYCMGMPFVDLAFLKKTDIQGGRITYCRKKTGQAISFMVTPKIQAILDRYPSSDASPYVLPIISSPGENERTQYENALRYANHYLKKIALQARVTANITTYTPRHTWASLAKLRQVQISTIKDALGHESEATTRIYLATLDTTHIDQANHLVTNDI